MLTMGCLAFDACEGEIRLSANHQAIEVTWRETDLSTEALGANPSLTIAAIAESIADRLVRGVGLRSLAARLSCASSR